MMSQITLLQKISLKNLSRPARFIHRTRGLHLVVNIIFNFHASHRKCVINQKIAFKKSIRKALFAALKGEEDYIEAPNLLSKINLCFT